jgi:hypothetical protein
MIVEFAGTPCAGKDTVICTIASHREINLRFRSIQVVDETIKKVFNREDLLTSTILSIFSCLADLRRISQDPSGSQNDLFLINRGLFDRLAFVRLFGKRDKIANKLSTAIETPVLLSDEFTVPDITFLFLTSFDKAVYRKKWREFKPFGQFQIVNEPTICSLNEHYLELYEELVSHLPIVIVDDLFKNMSLEEKSNFVYENIRRISG